MIPENGMITLFQIGNQPVTLYAICMAVCLLLGYIALNLNCKRKGLKEATASTLMLIALPLGILCARVFYVLCRLSFYREMGLEYTLKAWNGGYAMWGAIGGIVLAALITAKATRQSAVKLLDVLAAPGALTLALARLSEVTNGEGIGLYVENEIFYFFPMAVQNEWGEWYWAIFMLEALAALVIFFVLMRKKRPVGHDSKLFFVLFGTVSVLLESMRRDNFLRWLFVRVNQLTAVLVLTGIMVYALVRFIKNPEKRKFTLNKMVVLWVLYVLLAGVCIVLEFAIDKSASLPVWTAYCLMGACSVGMGYCGYKAIFSAKK